MDKTGRDLAGFTGAGYDVGRGHVTRALWLLVSGAVFVRWWCPARARIWILRAFGADIADNVLVRHRVRIHWPWKLSIGRNSWIGEGAWLLNLEQIRIGSDVVISQEALLCTGGHDPATPTFEFKNAPIDVGDGVWIAARVTVLPGVHIGDGALLGATALAHTDVPPNTKLLHEHRYLRHE